jgi:NadR type nicotinamide-nucleotide adenylyltransferase
VEKENIFKIAIVGPESTGKSELTKRLANAFDTSYVEEYARTYFNEHSIEKYTLNDLELIYRRQLMNEEEPLRKAKSVFFADTTLLTGKIWSLEVFGNLPPVLKEEELINRYHFYLLCDVDLPWIKDPQRKNPHNRNELLQLHIQQLNVMGAPFQVISGMHEQRYNNALAAVNGFLESIT